jgi:hypothetical protein
MKGGTIRQWLRVNIVIAAALAALTSPTHAQGSYPEPPATTRTFPITDQTIAQAMMTANPLSEFLRRNQNRYTLFPTAVVVPPGGWTVVWPAPAMAAPEKYFVSWSKGGGRFWAVDCLTQKLVQILGTTPIDLTCSRWVGLADKEVELYFFYKP